MAKKILKVSSNISIGLRGTFIVQEFILLVLPHTTPETHRSLVHTLTTSSPATYLL